MRFEYNCLKEPQLLESLGWLIYYLRATSLGKDTGANLEKRQHLTGCGVDCIAIARSGWEATSAIKVDHGREGCPRYPEYVVTVGLRIHLSVTIFSLNFSCLAKEAELFLEKWMINPQPIFPDGTTIFPDS